MQPPLSVGTLLQSRYRLMKILGQGGFGRTYLAADQGRFHEACVIKEFIPITGSPQALEKSKELFQREAQILHQIQHPQIPRFLATFEQDQRFFIVQDFVDGRVYSDLLSERLQQGQKFSEAEVLHFLEQMLPVLAYIHSKGIIHRDIAPDNIILRSSDHLPVLIDFGIVKDLASQAGAATDMPSVQGTTVGKLGYAPREQLQTGKSYPSSDLYALAVTTVVLLTARPPQDLVDEMTMSWRWHQWVPALTPQFTKVLNRMLSPNPQNRYQSATEVLQTLRSLTGLTPPPIAPGSQSLSPASPPPEVSTRVQHSSIQGTGIRDRPPTRPIPTVSPRSPATQVRPPASAPPGNQPWVAPAIALGLVLVALVLLLPTLSRNPETATTAPSTPVPPPTALPTPIPAPTPAATPAPATGTPIAASPPAPPSPTPTVQVQVEPLTFPDGVGRIQISGKADGLNIKRYLATVNTGQVLNITVVTGSVMLRVQDSKGESLQDGVSAWQSPSQGNSSPQQYQIDVVSPQEASYILEVTLGIASS
jgi:serine/threonine-protein kinase